MRKIKIRTRIVDDDLMNRHYNANGWFINVLGQLIKKVLEEIKLN